MIYARICSTNKKFATNLHFAFIYFLLFSKIISIISKKFYIFELNFLLDDAYGLEEDAHALSILKILY